ncbi:MAG: DNA polymerase III subunit beta [Thermodesulfovibrionales bacterium]|nr:DNA polymerase III subunit beta [Thermodesulfovibrionales bacterium]
MKVTVEKEELQKRLSDIQNIVEKKNTMPILNHFLLTIEKGKSYITATDLETAFKEPIKLTATEEGKMCIPARKLLEIVREMEDDIALESMDSQWVKVKSRKSHFRLACLSADEFPVWPSLENTENIAIPPDALLEMIEKTLYAAGEADTRYVLNGLLFHIREGGDFVSVGTDGHRLSILQKKMGMGLKEEKKLIISRKSISELRRFLHEESNNVDITIGKNHILFKAGEVQFLTRLIEGTYPNYEQVIPTANEKTMVVDRELLTKALRRVSIMSKERSSAVKMEIAPNNMVISASNPDIGEAKDEININYSGEEMAVAFNAKYILDSLNVMTSDNVIFKLNEALSPALIMEEGREDYKCVIMPMRL